MAGKEKPVINVVFTGHVDHGKSTLIGRMLFETGAVEKRLIEEYEKSGKEMGKASFKFAWVMDRLKEERERGLTIDRAHFGFETKRYYISIIDAPGHKDFIKNMITGASEADAAILVVSAKVGEYEAGMAEPRRLETGEIRGGQTREHAQLVKIQGVDQLIVAINKVDDASVDFGQERYDRIKSEVSDLLISLGYDIERVSFVPMSAFNGDNISKRSSDLAWYEGPTLLEALDALEPPSKPVDQPLRIPIDEIFTVTGIGTVACGRVETGVLKVGDEVVVRPANITGTVKSIEMYHKPLQKAVPGDNIGFNIKGVGIRDLRKGDVVGHPKSPPVMVTELTARIFVLYHPTTIFPGYTPILNAHVTSIPATIIDLVRKIDRTTGQVIEEKPESLQTGDAAIVKVKPLRPIVIERYSEIPQLGRFALRDMGTTIAAGIVIDVTEEK